MKDHTLKTAGKVVAAVVLSGCLIASFGLNIYQADRAKVQDKKVNKFIDNQLERQAKEEEKENTYQEDGYKVGEEYEIISTTHISDAYISGDDSKLTSTEDKKTLEMASDILKKIIKKDMSNYEKELAVYRWMYKNVGQGSGSMITLPGTSSEQSFTPYGVLTSGNAVCVGYATTFRLFMNMLGMDCHIVHNDYHSWDLVELEKDDWYQVDIYSDVSGKSEYRNFNMTDEIAKTSHDWDESALPEAKGVKYSYAVQNGKEVDDLFAVPAAFKKVIDKKKTSEFYKFKNPLNKKQLGMADLMYNQMNVALTAMPGYESWSLSASWYQDEDGRYILGLFAANYEEMEESGFDVDSKEGKQVTEAVAKAFGVEKDVLGGSGNGEDLDLDVSDDGGTRYETQNGEVVVTETTENGGSVEIP